MSNLLATIQPGDEAVIVTRRGARGEIYMPTTVLRVTKSGRVVVRVGSGEETFNPNGGSRGTSPYGWTTLQPMTPELRAKVLYAQERERLLLVLERIVWKEQPLEVLRAVVANLNKEQSHVHTT